MNDTLPAETPVRLRRLEPHDAEAYATVRAEALERHPLAFGSGPASDLRELAEAFRSQIADPARAFACGAFAGTDLVGIGRLFRRSGVKESHKCDVLGMYVREAHRGCGIGRALLRALVAQARSWPGVTHVHISVTDAAPEAARLYRSEGFRPWGTEPEALRWQGRSVAEHHMLLMLGAR